MSGDGSGAGSAAGVQLAHGEGGRLMRRLIAERLAPGLGAWGPVDLDDAARLPELKGEPMLTTDAYVVSPLFFPGGDIGRLAVFGTVNDLAVAGARPRALTLAMILEEGLPLEVLDRVLASVRGAAAEVGVRVVAGDTKVTPRGAVDRMFLTTTGLGERIEPGPSGPASLREGDELIVSGPIGRHGIAVLAAREGWSVDPAPVSDCAALGPAIDALRAAGVVWRASRDATRGGVAAVLQEWAETSGRTMAIDEAAVPLTAEVRGVCELLGLDPLHVACEGVFVAAVGPGDGERAAEALRAVEVSRSARCVGRVVERGLAAVTVRGLFGRARPLDEPAGAPLPRIC